MPGRSFSSPAYRFGFNEQEKDDEVKGSGNQLDFKFRDYDPRLGRFFSVDPLAKKFPMLTPYQFSSNSPIQCIDMDGLEGYKIVDKEAKTTTMVVDIYYVPQTKDNKKVYNSGFTQEQVESIKAGIMGEFDKTKFVDNANVDPTTGQAFTVKLQVNLHPVETKIDAYKKVNSSMLDPLNSNMLLEKSEVKTVTMPDGSIGEEQGGSMTGILRVSSSTDGHNGTHELFHNFIHNHPNASEANKTIIDPADQEAGHKKAGGIFIYENANTGTKKENLNQQNVNDAVNTLPEKK
jgi:RHS repeat-associated protein